MKEYEWLFTLPSLVGVGLLGMLVHFLKKNIKGETLTDIRHYFADNFKSTLVAIISTVIGTVATYFTLAVGDTIDLITVFGIGYTFDSFFNKWDKPV